MSTTFFWRPGSRREKTALALAKRGAGGAASTRLSVRGVRGKSLLPLYGKASALISISHGAMAAAITTGNGTWTTARGLGALRPKVISFETICQERGMGVLPCRLFSCHQNDVMHKFVLGAKVTCFPRATAHVKSNRDDFPESLPSFSPQATRCLFVQARSINGEAFFGDNVGRCTSPTPNA